MVRLMLVLAPVMCILSGIAVSSMLSTYMKQIDEVKTEKKKTKFEGNYFMRSEVGLFIFFIVIITLFDGIQDAQPRIVKTIIHLVVLATIIL